ncbi:hypothetical protein C4579_00145 [Candidatus Microgenomates bacterium]|nr:MAG: hypothetical protein C4579_00145 [Candidatus Microgenomates bacterium]
MIPAFLITIREVIEASLIVATILGILVKLNQQKSIKTVWLGAGVALIVSVLFLLLGSFMGLKVHELFEASEAYFEGVMMITSAVFITWAVFWLHRYFASYKVHLLQKVKTTIDEQKQLGLFVLVFTAVFREGIEIVLFLSTIYLSASPVNVLSGFSIGLIGGLIICALFVRATLRLPVYLAFRTTSALLVLFAAGLLARGAHEFAEVGMLPEFASATIPLLPVSGISADFVKSLFGLTKHMDYLQLVTYAAYIAIMRQTLFIRKPAPKTA